MMTWIHMAIGFFAGEAGQDTIEYVLVIGAVVVAMTIALLGFTQLVPQISGLACSTIDPLGGGICHFS